jgi:hypothetical protein
LSCGDFVSVIDVFGWAQACPPLRAAKEDTPVPLRPKNHYEQQAHVLLRRFIAARDAYVSLMNRDDVTHPVRSADYERQFKAIRTLIAAALRDQDQKTQDNQPQGG